MGFFDNGVGHMNTTETATGTPIPEATAEWPAGQEASPQLRPLWQLFDEVAARHGGRIAVTFGEERMSYRELHAKASQLAWRLRELGVGPESLVGVFLERTPQAIVALLGIVKAGGAYLPIDPAYPRERIETILEDARPAVTLSEEHLLGRLPTLKGDVICLDGEQATSCCAEAGEIDPGSDQDLSIHDSSTQDLSIMGSSIAGSSIENLAYVIYTSGSTGKPKGVMVTHANVARLLSATAEWFHFSEHDVWTVFHSLAFDFSVWEIWGCLLHGGRLVIVPFATSRSPEDFYELLVREQVTVLNQTPSAFYQLITVDQQRRHRGLALRVVIFGGEALNFSALRPWFALHDERQTRLINMYGITETTVHVTYREITGADAVRGGGSLIGAPIPDLQIHLLDSDRMPVPVGEAGEIYVGGAGVARGYLNRPELNAERFLPDHFSMDSGARLYKSGDLARYLADGELEYLGRGDDQVKIQGFRIELGEVEAAIVGHAQVREARVVAHTDGAGVKRLVAYFVAEQGAALATRDLSEFLTGKLPPWMLPSVYLPIESFPLTPHGKVDYAALPAPTLGSTAPKEEAGEEASGTDMEQAIAGVWRAVLGAEHVGMEDNFFDIGGTSLLLVSVHSKLQVLLNRKISVADLFAHTTVRALSEALGGADHHTGSWNALQNQAQKQRAAFARARASKRPV